MFSFRCPLVLSFAVNLFFFGAGLSYPQASAATPPKVVVNEMMYQPPGTNDLEQWFELFNADGRPADLSGWEVTKGVRFRFPSGTVIDAGGYLVVAADRATFARHYPGLSNVVGGWTGRLGHSLEISDAAGKSVNALKFYSEGDWAMRVLGEEENNHRGWTWFAPANGGGASLELLNPHLPNSFAHNWAPNASQSSTPGRANSVTTGDAAPFIADVSHWPPIPTPADAVIVSARIVDEAVASAAVLLHWRVDGASVFQEAAMFDDGVQSDGVRGDGVFAATLPAHPDHTVIEFFLTARDAAGHMRQYPAFLPPAGSSRTANLLLQVEAAGAQSSLPVYRIIMTEAERAELEALGKRCPDSDSDAEMNATWITFDRALAGGKAAEFRYNAGVRNRGHGTRQADPHNYHVEIPEDRLWHNQAGINLNSQYAYSQVIGSAVMRAAGLAMPESHAVQLRLNGADLNSFGVYAANEQFNKQFIERAFPLDSDGNAYRGIRDQSLCDPSLNGTADLKWHGLDWAIPAYTNAYFKQNHGRENDWPDLIGLIAVLNVTNGTTEASYVADAQNVINVRQWMRYMAANTLLDNEETALANGAGDDYGLYRGVIDARFQVLPYDLDSVMGRGKTGVSPRSGLFRMTNLPAMDRFMKTPQFARLYYGELRALANTVFQPERINSMLEHLLGGFVPAEMLDLMKSFNESHRAYVLSQVPAGLSVTVPATNQNGYIKTTTAVWTLSGTADPVQTRRIEINGLNAEWVAWSGGWTSTNSLLPGLNRLTIRALDEIDHEIGRTNVDVWFDDGTVEAAPAMVASDTRWAASDGPYMVSTTLTIARGATLTIEPGTTVYLAPGANLIVADGGRVVAEGSENAPIRFTRQPGESRTWGGIVVSGSIGSPETRITHTLIEFNGSTAIHSSGGTVLLDHLTFGSTSKQYVSLDSSSFIVSHCDFPAPTSGFELAHGTGGIKAGGHGIFYRNYFGTANGYNDVVDFTGGQRGGPTVYFLDNVFAGGGDDALDLDGTDAWIENNIFLHIHQNGAPDSSSAISGGKDGANTSEVTAIGNIIFDCDDAATAKEGDFFVLLNNTIVRTTKQGGADRASGVVNLRDTTPDLTGFGRGFYLEGNIIVDAEQLVRNYDPAQSEVTFVNNLLPQPWTGPGGSNYTGDALLQHIPQLEETQFASWEAAQIMRTWFKPLAASPARGTGPAGKGKGAIVAPGVYLTGVPDSITSSRSAAITVGLNRTGHGISTAGWPSGAGYSAYQWRIDGTPWSAEVPITEPIILSNLADGEHTLEVAGKSDAGIYQNDPRLGDAAVLSQARWVVDPQTPSAGLPGLRLNEILARNLSITNGPATRDLVEIFNAGSSPLDLAGMRLARSPADSASFVFPANTVLDAGAYLVAAADADGANPGFHLGFGLEAEGDSLYLFDPAGKIVDSVQFGMQTADYSIGRSLNGEWTLCEPSFGRENKPLDLGGPESLRINEWLARAEFASPGEFVELYNSAPLPVPLGGLFLSDAAGTPNRFAIPPLSFAGPKSFVSFAADGKDSPGHLNFELSPDVGQVQLSNSALELIDLITYGPQAADNSEGRSPDGAAVIKTFPFPTPGAPNRSSNGGLTNIVRTEAPVILLTNDWRYSANGALPASNWAGANYDDSQWSAGPSPFYHGNDEAKLPVTPQTDLPFLSPIQSAFYFRTHFNYQGETDHAALNITSLIDDGAVFYLNGVEVFRRNLRAGPVDYGTFASSTVSDGSISGPAVVPAAGLVEGDNVLAVEVHQANLGSSDIAMAASVDVVTAVTNIIAAPEGPLVQLNELLAFPLNGQPDWVELYNPSTNEFSLAGISLTDDVSRPERFVFPQAAAIPGRSYYVVFFNPILPSSRTNTGFGLEREGGAILLFDSAARGGSLLDAIRYGIQVAGFSAARNSDAGGAWTLGEPTPGTANRALASGSSNGLKINEWMANPVSGSDWFELFNAGPLPVALDGLYLTDDLTDRAKFRLPPLSFIGTGVNAFLRLEADGSPEKGARHVSFNLSAKGESIGLYNTNGAPLDTVVFGQQSVGVSEGRLPDGSDTIAALPAPSPESSNAVVNDDSDVDGLSDAWERAYFSSLSRNGTGDFDGDGLSDLDEFRAGSDPTNAGDFLYLLPAGIESGAFVLDLNAALGKRYVIEYADDLASRGWQPLGEASATGAGLLRIRDEAYQAAKHRFYRVRVE